MKTNPTADELMDFEEFDSEFLNSEECYEVPEKWCREYGPDTWERQHDLYHNDKDSEEHNQ